VNSSVNLCDLRGEAFLRVNSSVNLCDLRGEALLRVNSSVDLCDLCGEALLRDLLVSLAPSEIQGVALSQPNAKCESLSANC
jgi:hypothetical protein